MYYMYIWPFNILCAGDSLDLVCSCPLYIFYNRLNKKGLKKWDIFFLSLNTLISFQTNLRDTTRAFSVHGGPSSAAKSIKEGIKCKQHTTFDVAASLSNTRKAKHVRFSPGETVEVQFCAWIAESDCYLKTLTFLINVLFNKEYYAKMIS